MSENQSSAFQVENIAEYTEVKEFSNSIYANRHLKDGWALLGVFPISDGHTSEIRYVLGKKN